MSKENITVPLKLLLLALLTTVRNVSVKKVYNIPCFEITQRIKTHACPHTMVRLKDGISFGIAHP